MLELPTAFEEWMPNSRCYTEPPDPEMFFKQGREEEARKFCHGCLEQNACLSWAMRTDNRGVAGGLTHQQRARLQTRWDKSLLKISEQMRELLQDGKTIPNAS